MPDDPALKPKEGLSMVTIKILGSGCSNCLRLERHAAQAAEAWQSTHPQAQFAIEKVTEVERFLDYGLLATPGLVINEKLVSSGKIPAPANIVEWLEQANAA
jgi:hypothetical protein